MDTFDLFERLGLALAIGLLIGIERGWKERERGPGSRTAGIRTFALIGLLGGIMGALAAAAGPWPLAIIGLGFAAAFAAFQWREGQADNDFSITSVVAGVLTYALGAYAVVGNSAAAVAAGVAATALLAARQTLHDFLRRLTWPELRSGIVLLAMTFLLLPILPRETVDPWDALNPYELWLLVILIAVVSFAGYAAVRIMGPRRGLAAAAAAGALVSSTAVTLNNARLAAKDAAPRGPLAGAVCIAWCVSLLRMLAVASVLNRSLILPLGVPIASAVAVLALATAYFYDRDAAGTKSEGPVLHNPFELTTVFGFGAGLALVLIAAKLLNDQFGAAGLYSLAAVSGLVDVDPMTLSIARLAGDTVAIADATLAILIAGASNIAGKAAIAMFAGGIRFGLPLAGCGAAALALGVLVWLFWNGVLG